jgi:hypothetical protein|tara:strand:- start:53 stop:337 length:285 start_codon:yes stop_codon:yes gene_type:complete
MGKQHNTISKHDIIREIKNINSLIGVMFERISAIEMAFEKYLEMKGDNEELKKFLVDKPIEDSPLGAGFAHKDVKNERKQEKHNKSRRSTIISP